MDEYEEYLSRYCEKSGRTREEAEALATVKYIKDYYIHKEKEETLILRGNGNGKSKEIP